MNAIDLTTLAEVDNENMIIQTNVKDIVKELDTLITLEQSALDEEAVQTDQIVEIPEEDE